MWHPCEYKEWRGCIPGGKAVFACVWPMDEAPASVKWVEVGTDDPIEQAVSHEVVRLLAFQEWEASDG